MADSTSQSALHSVDPHEPDPNLIRWLKENCVPIGGLSIGALLFCLLVHYSSITIDWTNTKEFIEAFANFTQSVALIAGGVWAYFRFAKGRTFQDRLIANVRGKFVSVDGFVSLVVTIQLHNVGLSRIAFDYEASSLTVFEYVLSEVEEILSVKNNLLTSLRVFGDKNRYIESNEMIQHQILIALPRTSKIGYQLEIEVVADSGYTWRTTTIVDRSAFEDNENR